MVTIEKIAHYAFLAFVVIAIIAGLAVGAMAYNKSHTYPQGFSNSDVMKDSGYVTLIMLILGIIVGLVSITAKEVGPFLISAIALMVARIGIGTTADVWAPLAQVSDILPYFATEILNYIVAFVAPAAVLLAIRAVWGLEETKK
jgi:hypothetical protein